MLDAAALKAEAPENIGNPSRGHLNGLSMLRLISSDASNPMQRAGGKCSHLP